MNWKEIAMSKPSKTKTPAGDNAPKLDRRRFFMMGGSAVAAAAIVPVATEAEADESQAERVKARYNPNSSDVKNFYRVNRY